MRRIIGHHCLWSQSFLTTLETLHPILSQVKARHFLLKKAASNRIWSRSVQAVMLTYRNTASFKALYNLEFKCSPLTDLSNYSFLRWFPTVVILCCRKFLLLLKETLCCTTLTALPCSWKKSKLVASRREQSDTAWHSYQKGISSIAKEFSLQYHVENYLSLRQFHPACKYCPSHCFLASRSCKWTLIPIITFPVAW